ncbi:MAG: bifunctional adenosylcobinamide kinase/adenosylcobinamide-phosphate guanylyltransferase [Pseudomonadota bacterium]
MTDNLSTLILGGARSGKSRYAECLAERTDRKLIYLATAQIFDDEMRARVDLHIDRRGPDWTTHEEPMDLAGAIRQNCMPDAFVLVDCITLWLTNIMLAERDVTAEGAELVAAIAEAKGHLVLVSNEVGYGIVPENALARKFRDEAGLLNQRLAEVCERVVLVSAGLPLTLKAKT